MLQFYAKFEFREHTVFYLFKHKVFIVAYIKQLNLHNMCYFYYV